MRGMAMDEPDTTLIEETKKQMDIVPYTKRDRILTYTILIIVFANFVTLLIAIPWRGIIP